MAFGINKVILVGNLGKDPITQDIGNGVKKAAFTLATTEPLYSRDGTKTEHTEWHNIVLWNKLAEVAEKYLRKGQMIYLEGHIRSSQYTDKDGIKRFYSDIVCNIMTMLGGGKQFDTTPLVTTQQDQFGTQPINQNETTQENNVSFSNEGSNDDLPF
jgi:single-strand DNA-binding protein